MSGKEGVEKKKCEYTEVETHTFLLRMPLLRVVKVPEWNTNDTTKIMQ